MRLILELALLCTLSATFPWNRTRRSDTGEPSTPPAKKARVEEECYFSQIRKTEFEKNERPVMSIISLKCEGERGSLSDYFHFPLDPSTGETNATALLLCRGIGLCDLDFSDSAIVKQWQNVKICKSHGEELLKKWGDSHTFRSQHIIRNKIHGTMKEVCSMPDEICPLHVGRPATNTKPLTIQESDAILKNLGYLVHPGIPVCVTHRRNIQKLIPTETSQDHEKEKYTENSNSQKKCSDPSYSTRAGLGNMKSPAADALSRFAVLVGVDRVCFPQKPFNKLADDTKRKKACNLKQMFNAMCEIAAPGFSEELKGMVFAKYEGSEDWSTGSSKNLDQVLEQLAAQFLAAENRQEKLIVLGLAANSVPLTKIQQFIPNLSSHWYTAARKFARRERDSTPIKKETRIKYNAEAIQLFIDFITSSTVMIGLPYGVQKVKTSDGEKHVIPNTIRQQTASEIYLLYHNYLKEIDQDKESLRLPKSTVFNILDICAATSRKATTCVDYYVANGLHAFDGLHEILDEWNKERLTADDIIGYLKSGLHEALQYLRTDYRLHVKRNSRVADHCANFALSDPTDKNTLRPVQYSSSCSTGDHPHKHDLKCERCETMVSILTEIKNFAETFATNAKDALEDDEPTPLDVKASAEKREEELKLVAKYEEDIIEMKKHILRAAFTDQKRQSMINDLNDNEALVTLDFAQKYLPTWHREKQSDYFGKKGISYHVSHVTAKVEGTYVQHSFVHIYNQDVPQDSRLVVQTVSHLAAELKKVGLTTISLRSDNAGAYHCAATIQSLHWLMEKSGVKIKTYSFSEAQNGKGASDRAASQVKYRAERYVDQGNDITTSSQFFEAMKHEPVLNGFSFHHGSVTTEDGEPAKWDGISKLNHFEVEANGIRGFRYAGIGEGEVKKKNELKPLKGTFQFEDAGFIATGVVIAEERKAVFEGKQTKFWYYSGCSITNTCDVEPDNFASETSDEMKNDEEIGNLFACPEPGCSATFIKKYNVEKHILRDQHKHSPERLTVRDYAFKLYADALEKVQTEHTALFTRDALNQLTETSVQTRLLEGYGFPIRQSSKPFGEKVCKFLVKLFDEGLGKHAKAMDPMTAALRMRNEKKADGTKMFTVDEWKTSFQISGFFSREKTKRKLSKSKRSVEEAKVEDWEEYYPPDEEPVVALATWIKDELYATVADRMFNATVQSTNLFKT